MNVISLKNELTGLIYFKGKEKLNMNMRYTRNYSYRARWLQDDFLFLEVFDEYRISTVAVSYENILRR